MTMVFQNRKKSKKGMTPSCPIQTHILVTICVFLSLFVCSSLAQTDVCITVPPETLACEQSLVETSGADPASVRVYCLQKLFWQFPIFENLTKEEADYFEKKSQRFIEDPRPVSGFKTRKEYRTLSDQERERVHAAFQALYKDGTIAKYAKVNSNAATTGHGGPAFLGFMRVLLAFFEEELRRVEPTAVLPYWDYTMDAAMDNPVNSMVWSNKMFGNANGEVITGPFRNWFTPKGPLQRNYGQSSFGKLTTKDEFRAMFRKCRLAEVSFPASSAEDEQTTFEFQNNGVRNWIGGTIANTLVSAYDPVFYMQAAYNDFQWERFRRHQRMSCNVQDDHNYPESGSPYGPGHGAFDRMTGFSKLTNLRGLSSFWTRYWYGYEDAPSCPRCGSEHLWCNPRSRVCISHSRRTDYNSARFYNSTEPFEPGAEYIPTRNDYPAMPSPFNDGRTYATARYDARRAVTERRRREFTRTDTSMPIFGPPASYPPFSPPFMFS